MTLDTSGYSKRRYRLAAQSVPDLRSTIYGGLSSLSGSPGRTPQMTPRGTPAASPVRAKANRARIAKYRRTHSGNGFGTESSLEGVARRVTQSSRVDSPASLDRWTRSEDETMMFPTHYRRRVYTMPSRSAAVNPTPPMTDLMTDPTADPNSGFYRLRSFSVTSRGVVNLGDLLCYRSRSDVSMTSEGSSSGNEQDFRERASSTGSTGRSDIPHYRVLVLGEEDVGKSALIAQFKTSEYLTVRDANRTDGLDDDEDGQSVSILLDGEEAELVFTESSNDMMNDNAFNSGDAIIVTYSVTDRHSFRCAVQSLAVLRDVANKQPITARPLGPGLASKAVILVGNKADLARKRVVSVEDGRTIASKYDVKFIETSVSIHHNVDELLVGALSQVRLKARQSAALSGRHSRLTFKARGLMNRLLEKCDIKFRSCDNLHLP